jgi:hypothetical protein
VPSRAITTRTPAQVAGEVRTLITRTPGAALPHLASPEVRVVVPEATRLALGREAVFRLSVQVETGGQVMKNLAEVRSIRLTGTTLPAEIRTRLDRLALVAERRALAEGIQEVRQHAEARRWGEAAQQARSWKKALEGHPGGESVEYLARRGEVLAALEDIHGVSQKLEALEKFQALLGEPPNQKPGAAPGKLNEIDKANLPKSVEPHIDALRGLAELKQIASGKWLAAPDAARVKDVVGRLDRGLSAARQGELAIGKMIQQELAVRAYLEGHTEGYFKLMPEGGSKEFAGKLLRDLKAAALGEGKVETSVVKSALPAEPGAGAPAPRAPPGIEPLLPEGARSSWRPPIKESAAADLPPLEKAAEAGPAIQRHAEAQLPAERKTLEGKAETARVNLNQVYGRVIAPEQAERRRMAEIEAELERRLGVEERVRVRDWLEAKRTIPQMVADLNAQAGGVDEPTFLSEVEKLLGRPLSDDEKSHVKGLRRAGRRAAEVAEMLRL